MTHKILLADDSVTIQKVIELTFMDQDYEVTAVSTGDEAVDRLDAVDPDLVIADVHMPGASGYEVARRSKERAPAVPVLLLVGTFEPFDEGEMAESGADSHLKKPFDSQELLQLVESLMASAEEAREEAGPAAAAPPREAPTATSPQAVPPPPAAEAGDDGETDHAGDLGDGREPTWGNLDLDAPQGDAAADPGGEVLSLGEEDFGGGSDDEELSLGEDFSLEDDEAGPAGTGAGGTPSTQVMPPDDDQPFQLATEDRSGDDGSAAEQDAGEPAAEQAPFELGTPPAVEAAALDPVPPSEAPKAPPSQSASDAPARAPEAPAAEAPPADAASAPAAAGDLSDEDVDRIARRVAELMGQEAVRHVAWEVVPDLAEVLIRDRIRQLESQVE